MDYCSYVSDNSRQNYNDTEFLTWFIGFFEGDGSFWTRDLNIHSGVKIDLKTKRAEFEIVQQIENIKLLKYIRTKLGFGRVTTFKKNDYEYCRYYTSQKKNILKLIYLFNGNLILKNRRNQFLIFLEQLNFCWDLQIPAKPFNSQITLEDNWFSGFSDADAGFFTNVNTNFRGSKKPKGGYYIKFSTKFYITQRDEVLSLQHILDLFNSTTKIYTLTNGINSTLYNRIEICGAEQTEKLIQYFTNFPLKGHKKIDYIRWVRVHHYKNMHVQITESAAQKLARLLLSIEEPNLKNFNSETNKLSDAEISIFSNLPINQRHKDYKLKKSKKEK